MVEPNPCIQDNNYQVATTERFITWYQKYDPESIEEQDQVFPQTTDINYNNPLVGVSEYDFKSKQDFDLDQIFQKLTGNQKNQSEGVNLMKEFLKKLDFPFQSDQRGWNEFIEYMSYDNRITLEELGEGMDDRVRAIEDVNQRFADLYLRCKLKKFDSIYRSYQFIFKDGSRSQYDYWYLGSATWWRDSIIPDGIDISTVQLMFNKQCGDLNGLRFLDKNGTPILTCGRMVEDPNCLATPDYIKTELNLQEDQRIVGFKSVSAQSGRAIHEDLQFVLMAPITKTVLLKILANKQLVALTDRGLAKLPEGVFREVIRFVRY